MLTNNINNNMNRKKNNVACLLLTTVLVPRIGIYHMYIFLRSLL